MRLGLFGGRFDPPHYGHLLVGEQVVEKLQLDALWFVPAQSPPHKRAQASPEARYEMLLLATASNPRFRVSRLELERPGPSYTIDTVLEVERRHPNAELYFVSGADAYRDIGSW
ncbi:MAG TPA: nicotinate (nicotinamide) nucleotide adenylyltransferase, partial [Trueperaceae bacterium]